MIAFYPIVMMMRKVAPQPTYSMCGTTGLTWNDVTSPTGKVWMDRSIRQSRVPTSTSDTAGVVLYQWGRLSDGHQCLNSGTTQTLSTTDTPANGLFITPIASPTDWRNPQNNNLWQGVSGVNNPCPSGYRVPTQAELEAERLTWSSNNLNGSFGSVLKIGETGSRGTNGSLGATNAWIWTSNVSGTNSTSFLITSTNASFINIARANGQSVRCIKN